MGSGRLGQRTAGKTMFGVAEVIPLKQIIFFRLIKQLSEAVHIMPRDAALYCTTHSSAGVREHDH